MSEEIHLPKEEVVAEYLEKLAENGLTEEEIAKKINVSQSTVSRLLNKGMGLSYDSAYKAIILIQEYLSPLPNEPIKNFSYPRANDIKCMSSDDLLQEAALAMKKGGFTQIPIYEKTDYNKKTGKMNTEFVGILTDLGLLKRMSNPLKSHSKEKWLKEMSRLTIKEADVIEHVPCFPDDSSLIEIVEGLYHHYAVLITEESQDKVGMITRNDLARIWLELISSM
jgi:predicted transcriptional regulator